MTHAKPIAYLVTGALAIAAIVLLWWLVLGRPRAAAVKAASAHVEAATATATAGAAQDTVKIVTLHDKEIERTNAITREGSHAVESAADAGTPVPVVAAALRRNLCLFSAYRTDPSCVALPGDGAGIGAVAADPAGGAAGGR